MVGLMSIYVLSRAIFRYDAVNRDFCGLSINPSIIEGLSSSLSSQALKSNLADTDNDLNSIFVL
jgi:hypothetical protein